MGLLYLVKRISSHCGITFESTRFYLLTFTKSSRVKAKISGETFCGEVGETFIANSVLANCCSVSFFVEESLETRVEKILQRPFIVKFPSRTYYPVLESISLSRSLASLLFLPPSAPPPPPPPHPTSVPASGLYTFFYTPVCRVQLSHCLRTFLRCPRI